MGNIASMSGTITHYINFEDMQYVVSEQVKQTHYKKTLIVNTLEAHHQTCLISGTLSVEMEIDVLNAHLNKNKDIQIVIYGMNAADSTCMKKYEQLIKLGFYNVYIYGGGLFEWLLLQDVYGNDLFPTTSARADILKYKGRRVMNMHNMLEG
jgi:hypothetical protein